MVYPVENEVQSLSESAGRAVMEDKTVKGIFSQTPDKYSQQEKQQDMKRIYFKLKYWPVNEIDNSGNIYI